MISEKWRFWGKGKCKVYYRWYFYTCDHKNNYCELENCLLLICIQFKLICGTFLRYKQIYGEKLPLVKIRENKLFMHRPEAIGRPVIHTHHIYMNGYIFFWMLRAQIVRICNVEMIIWGFAPPSGAFSKWLSRRKCRKTKNRNSCISTSNYHRYTQFISRYLFLRVTNTVILVKKKSLHIKKDFKIHDGRQFWPKNRYQYEIN